MTLLSPSVVQSSLVSTGCGQVSFPKDFVNWLLLFDPLIFLTEEADSNSLVPIDETL